MARVRLIQGVVRTWSRWGRWGRRDGACGMCDGARIARRCGSGMRCRVLCMSVEMGCGEIVDVDSDKRGRTFRREMISIGSIEVWMR
jgi:hypothetical protein